VSCGQRRRNVLLLPCKHVVLCDACADVDSAQAVVCHASNGSRCTSRELMVEIRRSPVFCNVCMHQPHCICPVMFRSLKVPPLRIRPSPTIQTLNSKCRTKEY
jgi:hypothetical protein